MLKRLSLVVPLLAMPLLLDGCAGVQTPLDWFQSSLGWYRATPSNERTSADLDACKEQARAVNRREEVLQQDINGSANFPDTAATSVRDPTLTRNMQAYNAGNRYNRIIDDCMAARGYGKPGTAPGGGSGAPAGGVKIAPPPLAVTGSARAFTAAVLVIGNEILSGRTKDMNLGFLAEQLTGLAIHLREARVIADVEADIIAAVDQTRARYDYVFTTGGIGPTHDDITAACVAKAFGVALVLDDRAVALLTRHYPPGQLNEARLRMAHVPQGATLIDNPVSTAPGFQIGNVFVMAGVPSIMQAMFGGLKHRLVGGPAILSRTVSGFIAEGTIAAGLGVLQDRYAQLEIGSYPFFRQGRFGASFVLRGTDAAAIAAAAEELKALIRDLGAEPMELEPV